MTGGVKLAAFAAGLLAAFGIGFGIGHVAGPFESGSSDRPPAMEHDGNSTGERR